MDGPVTLLSLAVGLIAAISFVPWELRHRDAVLLDLRRFGERGRAGGSITLLAVFPFFQAVLGWSGLLSALALMPMAVLMMTTSGLAARLAASDGQVAIGSDPRNPFPPAWTAAPPAGVGWRGSRPNGAGVRPRPVGSRGRRRRAVARCERSQPSAGERQRRRRSESARRRSGRGTPACTRWRAPGGVMAS